LQKVSTSNRKQILLVVFVSDIAIFVLKRDVKLQPTNLARGSEVVRGDQT